MKSQTLLKSLGILFCLNISTAWADTLISTLPFNITSSGVYYLTDDLASAGHGITVDISAEDVTIDLRGHTITGGGSNSYDGIIVNNNVLVKDGTIRNFGDGIHSYPSANLRAINLHLIENFDGINSSASSNYIESCVISGGSRGIISNTPVTVINTVIHDLVNGIEVGSGSTVMGNQVYNNTGVGISGGAGSNIKNNVVYDNYITGINCYSGACTIVGNTVYDNYGAGIISTPNSLIDGNTADRKSVV